MKWHEGTPPVTKFCNDIFFVRIETPTLGGNEVSFGTHVWYGDRWQPLRYEHSGECITHWAYIDDPVPLSKHDRYTDTLGRLECVVQAEIHPDLQTPPASKRIE